MLRDLEKTLKRVVFGQDKAIEALSSAIKLARAGVRFAAIEDVVYDYYPGTLWGDDQR